MDNHDSRTARVERRLQRMEAELCLCRCKIKNLEQRVAEYSALDETCETGKDVFRKVNSALGETSETGKDVSRKVNSALEKFEEKYLKYPKAIFMDKEKYLLFKKYLEETLDLKNVPAFIQDDFTYLDCNIYLLADNHDEILVR
jgi:hypothetical protein